MNTLDNIDNDNNIVFEEENDDIYTDELTDDLNDE